MMASKSDAATMVVSGNNNNGNNSNNYGDDGGYGDNYLGCNYSDYNNGDKGVGKAVPPAGGLVLFLNIDCSSQNIVPL